MEQFCAFLRRKNIVFSAKRYGVDALGARPGLFCTLLVWDHSQYPGNAFHIGSWTGHGGDRGDRRGGHSLYHWGAGLGHGGAGYGGGHRLGPAGAGAGAFLPGAGGLCHQYPGRGWRAVGGAGHRHRRGGMRQGGLQGDQGGYPGDPHCDGFGGDRGGLSGGCLPLAPRLPGWGTLLCGPRSCSPSSWEFWSR